MAITRMPSKHLTVACGLAATLCLTALEGPAHAATTLVAGYYGAYAEGTGGDVGFPNPEGSEPYDLPLAPLSIGGSASSGNSTASVSLSLTQANGNIALHGSLVDSNTGSIYEAGLASSGFDLDATDTFYIGGSTGGSEQFEYTLYLNGSSTTSSDPAPPYGYAAAYGGLGLYANTYWNGAGELPADAVCSASYPAYYEGNQCGLINSVQLPSGGNGGTVSGVVTFVGGSTVSLSEYLWGRAGVEEDLSGSADFNALDTGYFTLTPITPGASFTTASGLTYAASPDAGIPELSTWALLVAGAAFVGVGLRMRRGEPLSAA
ncbi:MAG TPA: hypothetical protein VMU37_07695 [Caulobacteraceae bacterium]|nr:hypothetical protein [Caulobacteraceae bacterium]